MPEINEKDFLKVQFSVTDEHGTLVETTDENEAKKAGIFNEKAKYGYSLIMLSDSRLIRGFRDALVNAKENEEQNVNISKADGFGERKEELVVLVPQKKFEEANLKPQVGMVVDMDGSRGRIQSISGGRVRVDLNHELAGKAVVYKFKILQRFTDVKDKLDALMEEQLGGKELVKMNGDAAIVEVTQEIMKQEDYLQHKYGAIQAALQFIPEMNKLEWKEEFVREGQKANG